MKRAGYLFTACIVMAGILGCSSEPRSVTLHKPGVYKGAHDPLLVRQGQQDLIDRFRMVQTDR